MLYWGELQVPSGITAVMYATVPLTTALAARAAGLERLSPVKLIAAGIALVGVAVLFSSELRRAIPLLPLLSVLGSATYGALSGIALKRGPRQNPLGANAAGAPTGETITATLR